MKILIVEDDILSVIYFKSVLSQYGSCFSSVEGIQAVEEFARAHDAGCPYDIVCLDIMLPRMDGLQVLNEIRKIEKKKKTDNKTKVIMLSGLHDEMTMNYAIDVGCDAYIRKPVSIEGLEDVLEGMGIFTAQTDFYYSTQSIPC